MEISVWQRDLPALPCFPTLCGDLRCDVAVIGAGMTGLLTAFALREAGMDVVVIEGNIPGSGTTACSTGTSTVQHGFFYRYLMRNFGSALAQRYAFRQRQAVDRYAELVERLSIPCGFSRVPFYLYTRQRQRAPLSDELAAAQLLGADAHYVKNLDFFFPVSGAIVFPNQVLFHPMQFLYGLIPHLRIFAHSPVEAIRGGVLLTPQGRVHANHIVTTARLPFLRLPSHAGRPAKQERTCTLALEGVPALPAIYGEAAPGGLSFRPHGGGLLLGCGRYHVGPLTVSERLHHLKDRARELWPDCHITAGWTCSVPSLEHGFPYVGAYVGHRADLYVATGFSGWSTTAALVASQFISDRIIGK